MGNNTNSLAVTLANSMALSCHFMQNCDDVVRAYESAIKLAETEAQAAIDMAERYHVQAQQYKDEAHATNDLQVYTYLLGLANQTAANAMDLERHAERLHDKIDETTAELHEVRSQWGIEYSKVQLTEAQLENNLRILGALNNGQKVTNAGNEVQGHILAVQNRLQDLRATG